MLSAIKPTRELVAQHVAAKSQGKEDRKVEAKRFQAVLLPLTDLDGQQLMSDIVYRAHETDVIFSRWAQTQLWNRARVPVQFYDRCSRSLQEKIFNEHIPKTKGTLLLRRVPKEDNLPTDTVIHVRAVLTDSYGIIDDDQVFTVALDTLAEQGVELFRRFEYDDHITRLFVDFPDTQIVYHGIEHQAGLLISNSETGHSSVWIEPSVHIPSCHFVSRSVLKGQGVECRVVHRGELSNERLKAMVLKAKEVAQVGLVQIAEAWDQMLPIARVLSFTRTMDAMPDRIREILEENWSHQEEISKVIAAREIILAVQDLPLFQRLQIEQAAGGFIGIFQNYQTRLTQIMEEINS